MVSATHAMFEDAPSLEVLAHTNCSLVSCASICLAFGCCWCLRLIRQHTLLGTSYGFQSQKYSFYAFALLQSNIQVPKVCLWWFRLSALIGSLSGLPCSRRNSNLNGRHGFCKKKTAMMPKGVYTRTSTWPRHTALCDCFSCTPTAHTS